MSFRTGHIPDHPEVVARRLGIHLHPAYTARRAAGISSLPLATVNRAKLSVAKGGPGIKDQGPIGMCEGEGHSSGANLLLANQGTPVPVISGLGLYYGALMTSRGPADSNGNLAPILDTGTEPQSILNAWQLWGCTSEDSWGQYPPSSANVWKNPNDTSATPEMVEPKQEQLFAEMDLRFKGAHFVTSVGGQKILDILLTLAANGTTGYPLTDAIPASGPEFQGYRGGVLGALSGPIDHCNLIVDYEWSGTNQDFTTYLSALANGDTTTAASLDTYLHVIGDNSWSESWGEGDSVADVSGGLYRANRLYLDQAEDFCALNLVRV